ncbi:C-terminal region of band 7 [Popillia japonica]|uniref:C-terminal region of band 7 n=1 Tax=Popillia japonica TaxID=7064 RepID=A0AAW1JUP1_POPJA
MLSRSRILFSTIGTFKQTSNVAKIRPQFRFITVRYRSSTPINTVVMFVPQQEAWVVERMGKFHRILDPGLNILIPIIDKVKYVQSLKEIAIDVPKQSAITSDNVTLNIDEFAITQLAQTTMRSELGKIALDKVFRERENLNVSIVDSINKASEAWGITCLRYEIRDIKLPSRVQEAMQMQVEAERKKRAAILESEGVREADINVAEGKRQARILASEAEKQEHINKAAGEAAAMLAIADARATGLKLVAGSLGTKMGANAASFSIAEQYVLAFNKLAKNNNTLILPANAGDVSNMVGQAMTIYSKLTQTQSLPISNSTMEPISLTKCKSPSRKDDLAELFSDEEEKRKNANLILENLKPIKDK